MADVNENVVTDTTGVNADSDVKPTEGEENKVPTVEELSLELAKTKAIAAKYKNSIDKLTHNNAELTKWKHERMTAQEQQDEAAKEAAERQAAHIKELEDYKAINESSKRYIQMGMSVDLALETAKAEVSGDMDSVMKNIQDATEAKLEAAKAEWLKSRPDIKQGSAKQTEDDLLKSAFMAEFK